MRKKPESSRKNKFARIPKWDSTDAKLYDDLIENINKIHKQREKIDIEYDNLIKNTLGNEDDKIYAILKKSKEIYEKDDESSDKKALRLREFKGAVNKPFVFKGEVMCFDDYDSGRFSELIEKDMKNILIKESAKEQIARILYNKKGYYNLDKKDKKKILYKINKLVA